MIIARLIIFSFIGNKYLKKRDDDITAEAIEYGKPSHKLMAGDPPVIRCRSSLPDSERREGRENLGNAGWETERAYAECHDPILVIY